jgi:hypothetical protein
MKIAEAIVRHGTAAVLKYGVVAGDNDMPEIFLGGFIACGIHNDLKMHARVERLYTVIAIEHNMPPSLALTNEFGGLRADVAIYQEGLPIAVVELKKYDDYKRADGIAADYEKMRRLARLCQVDCYSGVLITQVANSDATCTVRAHKLEDALGHKFSVIGEETKSVDGPWYWLFASGKLM